MTKAHNNNIAIGSNAKHSKNTRHSRTNAAVQILLHGSKIIYRIIRHNVTQTLWMSIPFKKLQPMPNAKSIGTKVDASIVEGKATLVIFVLIRNPEL